MFCGGKMDNKLRKSLLKNTFMLYILTFSSYFLSFIVVPYQTRVLGPDRYGLVGVAAALMVYFQLIIDFGFLLSATEEVSYNRHDKSILSNIFSTVTICKLILSGLSSIILFFICNFVTQWKENTVFFFMYFLSVMINSLIPDYLYRGIERMGVITMRTVFIKSLFTVLVFVFIKTPEDYMLVPVFQIIGNTAALLGVYMHLFKKIGIRFSLINLSNVIERFKKSSVFFLSRIATTIYTVSNTIILDIISNGGVTAYYTSADKLISTAKSGLSPISDSLYPYMVKNKDFKIVKKILFLLEPIIFLVCLILFIWAEPICIWFFGDEFVNTASALRALLPIIVITLPNYIFGFPVLGAMGLSKHANYSVVIGSIIHVVNLVILYLSGNMNIITLGVTTSATELIVLVYRYVMVFINRNLLKTRSE